MLFYIFFNSLVKNLSLLLAVKELLAIKELLVVKELLAVKEILHPALITARQKTLIPERTNENQILCDDRAKPKHRSRHRVHDCQIRPARTQPCVIGRINTDQNLFMPSLVKMR